MVCVSFKKFNVFLIVFLSTALIWNSLVESRIVEFLSPAARLISGDNSWDSAFNSSHFRSKRQLPKNTCPNDLLNCYDGTCVEAELFCDGRVDCPDGSDETQARCHKLKCGSHLFKCSYGACVEKKAKCNGIQDCADNSDELHKDCFKVTTPNNCKSDFQCNDGTCIPYEDTCDGLANCPDGSDETITLCSTRACPSFAVRCAYGACISKKARCNNVIDCVDGSDEEASLCGRPPVKTEKPKVTTTTTTRAPPTVETPVDGACALPPQPTRGKYTLENFDGALVPGSHVPPYAFLKYTCSPGYDISPNLTVYCQGDGTWSSLPDCYKQCTMPISYTVDFSCISSNNVQFPCGAKVPFGTVVTFECKRNHFYPGRKKRLTCKDPGSFDNETPRCRAECGLEVSMGQAFAVNALPAKRGTFPWQVGLFRGDPNIGNWQHICGGTLISTHLFITAAHCVYDSNNERAYPASEFSAAVGKLYRAWNNEEDDALNFVQKSQVKSIHIPARYGGDQQNQQQDIAVLEVQTIYKLSDSVRPACLDLTREEFNRIQVAHKVQGKVAGWGLTQEDGQPSEVLQTLSMPIIEYDACKAELDKYQFRRYLTPDKLCAGHLNGSALCQGDSGGGLVVPSSSEDKVERWYLRGVVSVGPTNDRKTSCRTNTYTAFTEVFKMRDFLLDKFDELNLILT